MKLSILRSSFVVAIVLLCSLIRPAHAQENLPYFVEGEFAPDFKIRDTKGQQHSIEQYKGKTILLTFYRNAGCPVSYHRFLELEQERQFFESKSITLISVYESEPNAVKMLQGSTDHYQIMVADPLGLLYSQYRVDASKSKITLGYLHGAKQKAQKGKKAMPTKIKQDGNSDRLSAEFLIDGNGNILIAYYAKYLGDHLPLEQLKQKAP